MPRSKKSNRKERGDQRYTANRTRPTVDNFLSSLERLSQLTLDELKVMVGLAGLEEFTDHQPKVLDAALCKLFDVPSTQEVQLRVVRRILYGIGDTLLIARTGFGKSLTFQAYCALTEMIALQLIPLSKLGDQQARRMTRIKSAKACLITAETLEQDEALLENVRKGRYNHILLGPEQAVSPRFRRILRDPDFVKRVGIIIIDECHILSVWGTFRFSVTLIHELRNILPSRVVMYGCTATLTEEQERDVKKNGGFRPEDSSLHGLKVFRVDVDRPEIQLVATPIMQGKSRSYAQLYFVLNGAIQDLQNPTWFERGRVLPPECEDAEECARSQRYACTPQRIPKTIIFVDGVVLIETVAGFLRVWLRNLGFSLADAQQAVSTYSSHTSTYDQDEIIAEFEKEESKIRVLCATSAVGMGMDIIDIAVGVQWDLPLDQEVSDLWQRWGRVARGHDRTGLAVLFAPYYCFDRMGKRVTAAPHAPNVPSRLRESQTHSDDAESTASDASASDSSGVGPVVAAEQRPLAKEWGGQKLKGKQSKKVRASGPWTPQEIGYRARVKAPFLAVCNGPCCREPIMVELRNRLCEFDSKQTAAVGNDCCYYCGADLAKEVAGWAVAPDMKATAPSKPAAKTKAGKILVSLDEYVRSRAVMFSDALGLMCAAPSAVIMSQRVRNEIARDLGRVSNKRGAALPAALLDVAEFRALPGVASWKGELKQLAYVWPNVDTDSFMEHLRLAARHWPVFDWRNQTAEPEQAVDASTHGDQARREAELLACRRELQTKEDEIRVAFDEMDRAGIDSSGARDWYQRLIANAKDARRRAESIEHALAATRNVTQTLFKVALPLPSARRPAMSRSVSAAVSFQSSGGSVSPSRDIVTAAAVDSASVVCLGAVGDPSSVRPAAVDNVSRTRQGGVESVSTASPYNVADESTPLAQSTGSDRTLNDRPRTPVSADRAGKRAVQTPTSGRKGSKRKVPRGLENTDVDGDTGGDPTWLPRGVSGRAPASDGRQGRRTPGEHSLSRCWLESQDGCR